MGSNKDTSEIIVDVNRHRFIVDLLKIISITIHKYYLDDESFSDLEVMRNHYKFCLNKALSEYYKNEDIDFINEKNIQTLLEDYFLNSIYQSESFTSKENFDIQLFLDTIDRVFDYLTTNETYMLVIVRVYKIINDAMKKVAINKIN